MKDETNVLPKVDELTKQEEEKFEQNIVWLFGSRRSGTTWLGKELLSFNTEYMHEPDITDHLDLPMSQSGKNFNRRIDERAKISGYFFSRKYKKTWIHYLGKMIIYRIYAQFPTFEKNIIVKEPSTLLDASDIISASTPNSKIIILFRDGRDVIDSFRDGRSEGGWQAKTSAAILNQFNKKLFIERRAKLWVKQTENLLKAYENHNSNLRFLLRYEDLLNNTFNKTKELYQFLDISISDIKLKELIEKFKFENIPESERGPGKFYRAAKPGLWKENFNKKEQGLMHEIMGKTLSKAGYDVN